MIKKMLLIAFILTGTRSVAQEIVPITFGPLASMTSTSLSAKPDFEDQIAGSGYTFGAFARLKLLFIYAQAELAYSSKSSSVTLSTLGSNSNVTFKLSGADATAIVGMKLFGLGDLGNFRIFAGYNYNNYSDITYSEDGNTLNADNVNSSNSSLLFGIGIDLSRFTFDARYIQGFSDIASAANQEVNTKVVSLTLGFKIL